MAKAKRRKSSVSARERRARRARATREARRDQKIERELERRFDELFGAGTPPERAAELWLERLDGGPVSVKFSRLVAATASEEHVEAVAAAMDRLAGGSVPALSLHADIALQLRGDAGLASALIDRALSTAGAIEARVGLADHLLELGRAAEALGIVEPRLLDLPEDGDAERVYAGALELAHRRHGGEAAPQQCPCQSGRAWSDCCSTAERRSLERFADRDALHHLRDAIDHFIRTTPEVADRIAEHVEWWLAGAGKFARDAEAREALVRAATEHAWLVAGEDEDDDDDAPLRLFASRPAPRLLAPRRSARADAAAARRWFEHCHYSLWQIADPTPAPGVRVVDLMTSTRRYAAIPAGQLEGLARWTVLMGALVAIDGTWRTASALVPLRPSEADALVEVAEELVRQVAAEASGKRIGGGRPGRWREEPAGVLAPREEPAGPEATRFMSMVMGSGMPHLLAAAGELRARTPMLTNTDKDPLCLITATVQVSDTAEVIGRLAEHPDVRREDDGLTWWGRELDPLERETTLAQARVLMRERGEDPDSVIADDGPRRWLRGRLKPVEGGLQVEVNSRERLERFLELLRGLGEEPVVEKRLVIDPAQDMALPEVGSLVSLGASADSQAVWLKHFPDQPLPALDGRTPRQAALRERDAPRLERLLRELEHDADVLVSRGMPAPDIGRLRKELQAPASAWL